MIAPVGVRPPEPLRRTAPDLPGCLRDLSHPPAALWCLGHPQLLEQAPDGVVAIVGTRQASPYGERIATRLATACLEAGLVVVSGLARGIDAAAHRAALGVGMPGSARTIAVQGTGVDVPYPVGHRALHAEIAARGLVVSEMELGASATPGCFPRRNRLIAALAKVTVVVEAGFKSGAINTASQALELGRTVAAVPGQMDDPRAEGSNGLIRDGAQVVTSVEDLLGLYGLSTRDRLSGSAPCLVTDTEEVAVLRTIGRGVTDVEEIAFSVGLSGRQAASLLVRLELRGLLVRSARGYEVR